MPARRAEETRWGSTGAVQAGSPALGKGDPDLVNKGSSRKLDERGKTRQTDNVTIGAEDPNAT
jgi:hypothetical protein